MRPTYNIPGLSDWFEKMKTMRAATYARLQELALAWLVSPSPHLITTALVYSGLSSTHHATFYRLFSDASWEVDEMGERLFHALVEAFVPAGEPVHLTIDDTLTHHDGPIIDAVGCHIDPVRSSKTYKIKAFGHVWVIATLQLRFPFSPRDFALPIAFRLYRTNADCEATGATFRKKTELAEELMGMVSKWLSGRRAVLSVDSAYFCEQLLKNCPDHIEMIGRMKSNAALNGETPERAEKPKGRPRKQGHRMASLPELYADDEGHPWLEADIMAYRGQRRVRFKSLPAQWYGPNGPGLMRVVMVKMTAGSEDFRVYASTDPDRDPAGLLEGYAGRWSQEVTHRDLKQELGFGASGVRCARSVERMPPFIGLIYSVVVAWYAQNGCGSEHDWLPLRSWYTHKKAPSFADMIATAQHAIRAHGLFPEYGQHDFPRNCTPPWHPYTPPGTTKPHDDDHPERETHEEIAA